MNESRSEKYPLQRRDVVSSLLHQRGDMLLVTGLGESRFTLARFPRIAGLALFDQAQQLRHGGSTIVVRLCVPFCHLQDARHLN